MCDRTNRDRIVLFVVRGYPCATVGANFTTPWYHHSAHCAHCLIAINSDPKELVSQLACFLDIQNTGALFTYTTNPDLDLRVMESDA